MFEVVRLNEDGFASTFGISLDDVTNLVQALLSADSECGFDSEKREALMSIECPLDDINSLESPSEMEALDSNGLANIAGYSAEAEAQVELLSDGHPIRDQKKRGTCASFATLRALEVSGLKKNVFQPPIDLSEHFLHWNTKEYHCGNRNRPGTGIENHLRTLSHKGVCKEDLCPYEESSSDAEHKGAMPKSDAFSDAETRKHHGSQRLKPEDLNALKKAITGGSPVILQIPVFHNWYNDLEVRASGILYSQTGPHDKTEGSHAIVLVGYFEDPEAQDESYFVFDNSWGERWAESSPFGAGRGILPFNYVTTHCRGLSAYLLTH
ncbi:MAG: C1 family peptidase [Cyanobacteria bacterium REEB67]|nr:C1 family peptidase [Cyanobacteria bacterium REEB67]